MKGDSTRFLRSASGNRIRTKWRRLCVDVPAESFDTAFVKFSGEAEAFAMGLSDPWHRRFACRYLTYLQDVAKGAAPTKIIAGSPPCRLICTELERLFKAHLYRPETAVAVCA